MPTSSDSGLDIDLGNRCSRRAFAWAQQTWPQRQGRAGAVADDLEGSFSNIVRFGGLRLAMSSDGIGTKVELAERTGCYDSLGHDLVAMVVDDLVANGVEPCDLSNILDVDRLDEDSVEALMRGLHAAAEQAGVAVTGGEIAELGDRIGGWGPGMHFNWCATAIGVLPEGREPVDGRSVEAGDVVIALPSRGFRSNGFSLLRRVLQAQFGADWHLAESASGRPWGELALTPSRIYCRAVLALLDHGLPLRAIVHVTGGGVADNLRRVLSKRGLGAELDTLLAPAEFMVDAQRLGQVEERQAYTLWNMGQGMLLIAPPESAEQVVELLSNHDLRAQVAGQVTGDPAIVLASRGAWPTRLEFAPPQG